jgi:hypothetical protein
MHCAVSPPQEQFVCGAYEAVHVLGLGKLRQDNLFVIALFYVMFVYIGMYPGT